MVLHSREVLGLKIYKAYKFRMYPDEEQVSMLNSFLGTKRFIYNNYLYKKEKYRQEKIIFNLLDMKKDLINLQQEYPWLKEIDGCILRTTLEDLDNNYNYFNKKQRGNPKYKKKNYRESYRTVCLRSSYNGKEYASIKLDLERKVIKLPKLDEIKIRGYRHLKSFPHKILNATVSKEAGRYYVSVCVEAEIPEIKFISRNIIGIDLGIKDLIICSDGTKYPKIRRIKVQEQRIAGMQKALARCQEGSKNSQKLIKKIERAYQKIRNIRKYYIHKITTRLVKENDIIVAETLKVKEMIEKGKKHLAKSLSNASFQEITRQLLYKAQWYNKKFYQVNTYYASSQICSHCGVKNERIKELSIREWECICGNMNDRDLNASINIMDKGFEMFLKEQYEI